MKESNGFYRPHHHNSIQRVREHDFISKEQKWNCDNETTHTSNGGLPTSKANNKQPKLQTSDSRPCGLLVAISLEKLK